MIIWAYGMFLELLLALTCGAASREHIQDNHESPSTDMGNEKTTAQLHHCHVCGKPYVTENGLLKHIQSTHDNKECLAHFRLHPPKEGEIRCAYCGKKVSSRDVLYKHIKSDHPSRPVAQLACKSVAPDEHAHTVAVTAPVHDVASLVNVQDETSVANYALQTRHTSGLPANSVASVGVERDAASALPVHSVPRNKHTLALPKQKIASHLPVRSSVVPAPALGMASVVSINHVNSVLQKKHTSVLPAKNVVSVRPVRGAPYIIRKKHALALPAERASTNFPVQSTAYLVDNKHSSILSVQNDYQAIHNKQSDFHDKPSLANPRRDSSVTQSVAPIYDIGVQLTGTSRTLRESCTCTDVPGLCPICKRNKHISTHRHDDVPDERAANRRRNVEASTTFTQSAFIPPQSSKILQNQMSTSVLSGNGDESFPGAPLSIDPSAIDNLALIPTELTYPASNVSHEEDRLTSLLENNDIDPSTDLSLDYITQSEPSLPDPDGHLLSQEDWDDMLAEVDLSDVKR